MKDTLSPERRKAMDEALGVPPPSSILPPEKRKAMDEALSVKPKDPSFIQRVGEDWSKGFKDIKESGRAEALGKQGGLQTGLQTAESIGGMIGAPVSEAISGAYKAIPQEYKQPVEQKVKQAAQYVASTDIGKKGLAAAAQGKEKFDEFAKAHPQEAKTITGLPNLLNYAGLSPAKSMGEAVGSAGLTVAKKAGGELASPYIKQAGKSLIKSGDEQVEEKLINMIRSEETKKVAAQNVPRTIERGLLETKYVVPTATEKEIVAELKKVPGINENKSYLHNYTKASQENVKEAQALESALQKNNVDISADKIQEAAQEVKSHLNSQTFFVGDGKKSATIMLNEAQKIINKNGATALGLLKSRKEFDKYAKSQMTGLFDNPETARKATYRAVRNSLNKLVEESAPNVKVRESLKKQSRLFSAMDSFEDKAATEGKNLIVRKLKSFEDALPFSNQYYKHAASLAGLGAAVTHPLVVGGAVVPYAAYKAATSPTAKKIIGRGLTKMGDVLAPAAEPKIPLALPAPKPEYKAVPHGQRGAPRFGVDVADPNRPYTPPAPPKQRMLPAPEPVTMVDRQGVAKAMTDKERQAAEAARAKVREGTIMSPTERGAKIRNEVNKAYEQNNLKRNAVKEAQIAKIAEQSQVPVAQLVEMSDKNIKELADILGTKHTNTAFAQALRKAVREGK